ncbi:hypothetical protein ZWY2020_011551 [Hordeum vulgare]|nr:hypothetical protein ZWY2020_011551 [Hordeum vulgare]
MRGSYRDCAPMTNCGLGATTALGNLSSWEARMSSTGIPHSSAHFFANSKSCPCTGGGTFSSNTLREIIGGAFLLARFRLVSGAGGGGDGRPKSGGGDRDGLVLCWPRSCGGLGDYLCTFRRHSHYRCLKDYALEHFPREYTIVILQLPGKNKDWKSTFRIRPSGVCAAGRCNLYLGNFARDNHVRAGDICLFQPMTNVKQRRFVVKVHILHKMSTDGTTQSSGGKGQDSHGCLKEGSSHNYKSENTPAVSYTSKEFSGENRAIDEVMELDDLQTLSKDYVLSGKCDITVASVFCFSNITIKKDYAIKYFPCEDATIILQLPRKDKNWKCKLHIRASGMCNAGRRTLYLGRFVHDTHIRVGDICLFQPMTNLKQRRFIVIVHLLHKESIAHSLGGRTDIGSNRGSTCAKMGGIKEEPPTDGLFILSNRAFLTPAQYMKCLEKVEEIKFKPPFYVSIMSKTTVWQHDSECSPILTILAEWQRAWRPSDVCRGGVRPTDDTRGGRVHYVIAGAFEHVKTHE